MRIAIMGSLILQLIKFMRANGKLWMAPIFLGILGLAILLIAAQSTMLAPFIYAIF